MEFEMSNFYFCETKSSNTVHYFIHGWREMAGLKYILGYTVCHKVSLIWLYVELICLLFLELVIGYVAVS